MTVCRLWRGWASPANADAYERVLREQVIPQMIEARGIRGFRHIDVLRRDLDDEVEFATLMWFDSFESITDFVGKDIEVAHVPDVARALLSRFDERATHFEVLDRRPQ